VSRSPRPTADAQRWDSVASRVRLLAPAAPASTFPEFLAATTDAVDEPFRPVRLATLARLSSALLADPVLRRDPASVALAYWLRRGNLGRFAEEDARRSAAHTDVRRVPVGRVLHLAPANVDTLFVYSWALAYLCGNASVVRVSQDLGLVVEALLRVIGTLAADDEALAGANRFVTYPHDDAITTALSAWCTHRVIWGGDETVAAIRALPLPSHASERVFGSKYSFAAIAAERYCSATPEERAQVASGFFNDLFWFDQMACSSPQVLFWVGAPAAGERAAAQFELALEAEVERRRYRPPLASAVHRRSYAFGVAASIDVRVRLEHAGFVGVHLSGPAQLEKDTCGGGLLRHVPVATLEDVLTVIDQGDQTMTHWGFEAGTLGGFARQAGARGLDRVVPIGEALAFDVVWDGFDLIEDMIRRVRVRASFSGPRGP